MRRRVNVGVVLVCVVVASAGCSGGGTDESSGATPATAASTTQAPPAIVGADLLDVGPYPKVPRPPLGVAGNPSIGALVEAQRMAGFVVGPWQVDDGLVTPYLNSFYVLDGTDELQQLGPAGIAAAAGQNRMIDGFASAREKVDVSSMVNAVLRFPDEASARAATAAMGAASVAAAVQGVTPTSLPIAGHPDATASTYPFTARATGQKRSTVRSFIAHGPFVFMHFVQSVDGVEAAAAMVAKAIDQQGPLIDRFRPADPAALSDVPLDPTGLLARTLPAAAGAGAAKNAVYSDQGAQHFQTNPIASQKLFSDNGITDVAMGLLNVYQTRDASAAKAVTDGFDAEVATQGTTAAPGVPALPDSHCLAFPKQFYCVAPAAEYAIEARAETLADVQQQVAAQYVILTAK